jgi:hypothetical protein
MNFGKKKSPDDDRDPREFIRNCIYLEDSMIEVFGVKIYGSPWYIVYDFKH